MDGGGGVDGLPHAAPSTSPFTPRLGGGDGGSSGTAGSADSHGGSGSGTKGQDVIDETDPTGRWSRYNVKLGSGAFKTVWKAFDNEEAREVAWNKIHMDKLGELERGKLFTEVNILRSIHSPHIISCLDHWVAQSDVNFITEAMTSGTLKQYIAKAKRPKVKVIRHWCHEILSGLIYLHSRRPIIIHRDLKCDNVLINGNSGVVKIGDLGLATLMTGEYVGSVIGTPEFMAPELYDEHYTEKCDVYAFGMCVLEMVTGKYPYGECTTSAQVWKKVSNEIPPDALSEVSEPLALSLITSCTAREPSRLSSFEAFLHPFLDEPPPKGPDASAAPVSTSDLGASSAVLDLRPSPDQAAPTSASTSTGSSTSGPSVSGGAQVSRWRVPTPRGVPPRSVPIQAVVSAKPASSSSNEAGGGGGAAGSGDGSEGGADSNRGENDDDRDSDSDSSNEAVTTGEGSSVGSSERERRKKARNNLRVRPPQPPTPSLLKKASEGGGPPLSASSTTTGPGPSPLPTTPSLLSSSGQGSALSSRPNSTPTEGSTTITTTAKANEGAPWAFPPVVASSVAPRPGPGPNPSSSPYTVVGSSATPRAGAGEGEGGGGGGGSGGGGAATAVFGVSPLVDKAFSAEGLPKVVASMKRDSSTKAEVTYVVYSEPPPPPVSQTQPLSPTEGAQPSSTASSGTTGVAAPTSTGHTSPLRSKSGGPSTLAYWDFLTFHVVDHPSSTHLTIRTQLPLSGSALLVRPDLTSPPPSPSQLSPVSFDFHVGHDKPQRVVAELFTAFALPTLAPAIADAIAARLALAVVSSMASQSPSLATTQTKASLQDHERGPTSTPLGSTTTRRGGGTGQAGGGRNTITASSSGESAGGPGVGAGAGAGPGAGAGAGAGDGAGAGTPLSLPFGSIGSGGGTVEVVPPLSPPSSSNVSAATPLLTMPSSHRGVEVKGSAEVFSPARVLAAYEGLALPPSVQPATWEAASEVAAALNPFNGPGSLASSAAVSGSGPSTLLSDESLPSTSGATSSSVAQRRFVSGRMPRPASVVAAASSLPPSGLSSSSASVLPLSTLPSAASQTTSGSLPSAASQTNSGSLPSATSQSTSSSLPSAASQTTSGSFSSYSFPSVLRGGATTVAGGTTAAKSATNVGVKRGSIEGGLWPQQLLYDGGIDGGEGPRPRLLYDGGIDGGAGSGGEIGSGSTGGSGGGSGGSSGGKTRQEGGTASREKPVDSVKTGGEKDMGWTSEGGYGGSLSSASLFSSDGLSPEGGHTEGADHRAGPEHKASRSTTHHPSLALEFEEDLGMGLTLGGSNEWSLSPVSKAGGPDDHDSAQS